MEWIKSITRTETLITSILPIILYNRIKYQRCFYLLLRMNLTSSALTKLLKEKYTVNMDTNIHSLQIQLKVYFHKILRVSGFSTFPVPTFLWLYSRSFVSNFLVKHKIFYAEDLKFSTILKSFLKNLFAKRFCLGNDDEWLRLPV